MRTLLNLEDMNVAQLFDELSAMLYYGAAFRHCLRENEDARNQLRHLLAELRNQNTLADAASEANSGANV